MVLAFAVGWTGSTLSNGQIIKIVPGLVTALDSVLGNLLGETTAGAKIGIINTDAELVNAVQIDVDTHTAIPVLLNMFYPPDPILPGSNCEVVMQVHVTGDKIVAVYDASRNITVEPGHIDPDLVPAPCQTPDPVFPER